MSTTEMRTTVLGDEVSLLFNGPWVAYWMALLRVLVGFWFLHAGLTKIMFGFDAQGYMQFASAGTIMEPIMTAFSSGAALMFTNIMIPLGEFLIGLGLLLGAFVRLASFFGAFLMFFFYLTNADWAHGFTNGDLWGLLLFITLAVFGAGRVWGLDGWLESTNWVENNRWARYLLG